jgi:hypothetical protein
MGLACTLYLPVPRDHVIDFGSYNGTSDLQLERMNVYFNEVSYHPPMASCQNEN